MLYVRVWVRAGWARGGQTRTTSAPTQAPRAEDSQVCRDFACRAGVLMNMRRQDALAKLRPWCHIIAGDFFEPGALMDAWGWSGLVGVGFGLGVLGLASALVSWGWSGLRQLARSRSFETRPRTSQGAMDLHVDTMIDSILDGRRLRELPPWKYSRALGSGRAAAMFFTLCFHCVFVF